MSKLIEVQVDRIVGPSHHFGGLGMGNIASKRHAGNVSNPKAAAIQGLEKMQLVQSLGVHQFVLPPHPRPHLQFLAAHGCVKENGSLNKAALEDRLDLISAANSSSPMWMANAATITPRIDRSNGETAVGKVSSQDTSWPLIDVTTANLNASLHRSIEDPTTHSHLAGLLQETAGLHAALPGGSAMRDEGAANHMRLSGDTSMPGINIFVYGDGEPNPSKHWPRQTLASCQSLAALHGLPSERTFLLKQHPDAIDAGAFHNDVVAMSHDDLWIHHEFAYWNREALRSIEATFTKLYGQSLRRIEIPSSRLDLSDAISTYLFNSQIVSAIGTEGKPRRVIICPDNVRRHQQAKSLIDQWLDESVFADAHYVDLNQSMAGGGGPACLRLRLPISEDSSAKLLPSARLTESKSRELRELIEQHYPTEMTLEMLTESKTIEAIEHATNLISQSLLG